LTSNTGDLLDDEELVGVLANTKAKAAEVNAKLIAADGARSNIAEKREQFRPAATRGSVLYFSIVEMSLVNVMHQTSLTQFLDSFHCWLIFFVSRAQLSLCFLSIFLDECT